MGKAAEEVRWIISDAMPAQNLFDFPEFGKNKPRISNAWKAGLFLRREALCCNAVV